VTASIRPFYADWAGLNRRITEGLAGLAPEVLALEAQDANHWPVWAIAAHMAGVRVFWLCHVLGEPGAEATPFAGQETVGWEDDLSRPRSGRELAEALTSTWGVVEGCLRRWTPAMLGEAVRREEPGRSELHTRQSILIRMISHDGYHLGEINTALVAGRVEPIDPWPGAEWAPGAPVELREGRV
jgi:uncharacterized damage-inducible protein DinB